MALSGSTSRWRQQYKAVEEAYKKSLQARLPARMPVTIEPQWWAITQQQREEIEAQAEQIRAMQATNADLQLRLDKMTADKRAAAARAG